MVFAVALDRYDVVRAWGFSQGFEVIGRWFWGFRFGSIFSATCSEGRIPVIFWGIGLKFGLGLLGLRPKFQSPESQMVQKLPTGIRCLAGRGVSWTRCAFCSNNYTSIKGLPIGP